jgi:hypothetical protein
MTKEKARNQLLIGYIFAGIGFAIGANNDIYQNPLLSFFFIGYAFWGAYWGWLILYKPISDFFSRMIVFEDNLYKLFIKFILKRLIVYGLILSLGIVIGTCGGAIWMQIKLSQIAYK